MRAVRWTGTNTREVKAWIAELLAAQAGLDEAPDSLSAEDVAWFVPRRSTGMTLTLWANIADADWGSAVTAAVYCPVDEEYRPIENGQWIIAAHDGGFEVADAEWEPARG